MELIWRAGKDVSDIPYNQGISPYAHFWLTQMLPEKSGAISAPTRELMIVMLSTGLNASVDDLIKRAFES